MTSLSILLATNMQKLLPKLVPILIIVAVAIVVFAFLLGMSKGFGKVGKGGFYWLIAGGSFIFLYRSMASENSLEGIVSGKFSDFLWALVLVVGCILATIIFCGAIAALFRPIEKDKEIHWEMDDWGEVDANDADRTIYKSKSAARRNAEKPGIVSRLFGGVTCVVNMGIIIAVLGFLVLVLLQSTSLAGRLDVVYGNKIVGKLMPYVKKYIMDFITVGLIYFFAMKGFNVGFVGTTRILVKRLGMLVALIFGIAIPFIAPFKSLSIVSGLASKFALIFDRFAKIQVFMGRLVTGVLFAIILMVIVAIINSLLKKLTYNIEDTTVIRIVDGCVATLLYLVIGALLCILFWAIMYTFSYVGIFNVDKLFTSDASFSRECFDLSSRFMEKILDTYLVKLKSFL